MKEQLHLAMLAIPVTAVVATTLLAVAAPPDRRPLDIPSKYGHPASPEVVERLVADVDMVGFRHHAWNLWAGLTLEVTPSADAANNESDHPLWRTWWPASATKDDGSPPSPQFELARQLFTIDLEPRPELPDDPRDVLIAGRPLVMGNVLFNDAAHCWIRDNDLQYRSKLQLLHDKFTPKTPVEDRRIPDFPREAIALKAVWFLVHHDQPTTELPVWNADERKLARDNKGHPPSQWMTKVYVAPAPIAQPPPNIEIVPLDRFFFVKLITDELVNSANASLRPRDKSETAKRGDYAVLVGMHVATKELPDWLWATYWWHNRPDEGEFAQGRPASVKGRWRNFVMDVTFDADVPHDDAKPNICYNPWLEARLSGGGGGVVSNCIACHAYARWHPTDSIEDTIVQRGPKAPDDATFADAVRLDYLWSLNRPKYK